MTVQTEQFPIERAAATAEKSELAEFGKFCRISAIFLAGFLAASLALNGVFGNYLHRAEKRGGLGAEVQQAIERVDRNPDSVHVLFLGDSVSRQLFMPKTEPSPDIRFLTSNQAITMAGQCYLAEGALKKCPNVTDVYLFYLPAAWRNDMPRDYTHDYFCGHFHTLPQVIEVFKVKRDLETSFAHLGRWLWPHIMAINSMSQPAFAMEPDAQMAGGASPAAAPPDPERLLTWLSSLMAPPPPNVPSEPPGKQAVILSPVSRYYLQKLRDDCARRRIRLHVLPCPVAQEKNHTLFVDADHLYDAPIIQDMPISELMDGVHLKKPFIAPMRRRMIEMYGLHFLDSLWRSPAPPSPTSSPAPAASSRP